MRPLHPIKVDTRMIGALRFELCIECQFPGFHIDVRDQNLRAIRPGDDYAIGISIRCDPVGLSITLIEYQSRRYRWFRWVGYVENDQSRQ